MTGTDRAPIEGDEDEEIESRAPVGARAYTWLFLAMTGLHAALLTSAVLALRRQDAVLRGYAADPASIERPEAAAAIALAARTAAAMSVALWVYLLMFAVWFALAGRIADRLGRDRRPALRHWTFLAWRLALVPVLVHLFTDAARAAPAPSDRAVFVAQTLAADRSDIVFAVLRIVMLGLLAAYVAVVWRRLDRPGERPAES